jgi:hypothetical protein
MARTGNLVVQAIEMDGEEVFVACLVDFAGASVLKSSEPLTAQEFRTLLREAGETDTIIDERMNVARQAPVT